MRGDMRSDMAAMKGDLMKWSLLLWVGQFAALLGALSYMLPVIRPRQAGDHRCTLVCGW